MIRFFACLLSLIALAPGAHAEGACGWQAPRDLPLVDTNVGYWRLDFDLPPHADVELSGRYPYARQISFNVYNAGTGQVLGGVTDLDLTPRRGGRNPFQAGAPRRVAARSFGVTLTRASQTPTQTGAIAASPDAALRVRILYRIYLPDADKPGGGASLPNVFIRDADGRRMRVAGGRSCPHPSEVAPPQDRGPTRIPPSPGAVSMPLDWRLAGTSAANSDILVNRDNGYVYALTHIEPGAALLLTGTPPTHPTTTRGDARMGAGQVRYWSLCAYRHPSDRSAACLADEAVALDQNRRFTIAVVGPDEQIPAMRCGVSWLVAPAYGDGALMLRHVAPDRAFANTPLRGEPFTPAAPTLGPFLPESQVVPMHDLVSCGEAQALTIGEALGERTRRRAESDASRPSVTE
jgi:hypothetical protein